MIRDFCPFPIDLRHRASVELKNTSYNYEPANAGPAAPFGFAEPASLTAVLPLVDRQETVMKRTTWLALALGIILPLSGCGS